MIVFRFVPLLRARTALAQPRALGAGAIFLTFFLTSIDVWHTGSA